eukprot:TRINITY_DN3004_c0_g1_i8.p1 TRINITY_DN3004_c0_g1~~TRINITY_DN3004_c0_g1_i8.p1  ORF type:complete len:185 (-),score=57.91 TRINITY_DN3004_c0_g1_i8:74-628(-)
MSIDYQLFCFFFFQAEDGIRDAQESRGLGDVYKRQSYMLSRGLQECPKNGELWALSIELEPKATRKAKSVDAMKHLENDPHVVLAVAKLFWKEKKYEKARKWLERVIILNPKFGDGWAYFYKYIQEQGTTEEKQEVINKCVEADPNQGKLWISISKDVKNWSFNNQEILQKTQPIIEKEMTRLE